MSLNCAYLDLKTITRYLFSTFHAMVLCGSTSLLKCHKDLNCNGIIRIVRFIAKKPLLKVLLLSVVFRINKG